VFIFKGSVWKRVGNILLENLPLPLFVKEGKERFGNDMYLLFYLYGIDVRKI